METADRPILVPSLSEHINKATLDRQAAAVLRRKVLSGEFPPGYRLIETGLAEQLQLSRGTIRAALSELVHEGLVEQIAYTRWAVHSLSATDAWELYTLRSALEGLGARLAAERLSEEMGEKLRAAFENIKAAAVLNDRGQLAESDAQLHKLIIEMCGHKRLHRQYTLIEQQTRRYIACSNALTIDADGVVSQHAPIVSAILSRLPDLAEREARRHNLEEGSLLVKQLAQADTLPANQKSSRAAAKE